MNNEKVLSPEEEKLIENISGVQEENLLEGMGNALEKEAKKAAIIDKASDLEDFHIDNVAEPIDLSLEGVDITPVGKMDIGPPKHIENASEVLVEGTKVNQLGADMVKLAGIDSRLNEIKTEQETIRVVIDEYLKSEGLFSTAEKLKTEATSLRKDYGLLKTDIGERALSNYEKTKEKKPALGCEIKMFKNRDFTVDEIEAIPWLIADEKMHVFLTIKRDKYADQLALGTFPDMPGKVDDSKIPKASISIKPYQKKEG